MTNSFTLCASWEKSWQNSGKTLANTFLLKSCTMFTGSGMNFGCWSYGIIVAHNSTKNHLLRQKSMLSRKFYCFRSNTPPSFQKWWRDNLSDEHTQRQNTKFSTDEVIGRTPSKNERNCRWNASFPIGERQARSNPILCTVLALTISYRRKRAGRPVPWP